MVKEDGSEYAPEPKPATDEAGFLPHDLAYAGITRQVHHKTVSGGNKAQRLPGSSTETSVAHYLNVIRRAGTRPVTYAGIVRHLPEIEQGRLQLDYILRRHNGQN